VLVLVDFAPDPMSRETEHTAIHPDAVFTDRDLSWLSFNERVLMEAQRASVPLMERIRFLAIYSSNLDEFYRVRIPAVTALHHLMADKKLGDQTPFLNIKERIAAQQRLYGSIIENDILQALSAVNVHLIYNEPVPEDIREAVNDYFMYQVATYMRPMKVSSECFPENNKIYFVAQVRKEHKDHLYIINVPSDVLPRFLSVSRNGQRYVVVLDDIVRLNLPRIFSDGEVTGCTAIKVNRNAELNVGDEYTGNLAAKIEEQLTHRDAGLATRLLYEPGMSDAVRKDLSAKLKIDESSFVSGGRYHNLKDLSTLPLPDPALQYEPWPVTRVKLQQPSLFDDIATRDILIHPPYNSYDTVLRFFNEAVIDQSVTEIYVTLYRVASDSRVVNALIHAALNGKKVTVFVELKARFDEANNLKWSKRMKQAGVTIIESIPGLKVHAKVALVVRKNAKATHIGLIATGNFNESTARYYTDHVLLTAHADMLGEAENLFRFLKKRKLPRASGKLSFRHLLVAQFNLQERFLELIDAEIRNARQGLSAYIKIKLNNIEDKVLISRLYEASMAGVQISLIVRGICCLAPGVESLSTNISAIRIVDRYLEHGRMFIFCNDNNPLVFMGSADWMNRNIYRRIEVCCPVLDNELKHEMIGIFDLQFSDTAQAVSIQSDGSNLPMPVLPGSEAIRSQRVLSDRLQGKHAAQP
jgi:polyphosphate kinase